MRKHILLVTICWLSLTTFAQSQDSVEMAESPQYSLHEWGVFTAPRGAEWLKQDMLREWQSFPDFFQGVLPERGLVYRGPVTKPVIFFHASESFEVDLLLQFATGQPLIWWPPVEYPASGTLGLVLPKELEGIDPKSLLHFQITLNEDIQKRAEVPDDHWVNGLRKVKSATVSVEDSYSAKRRFGENRIAESFVYYDGLMKPPSTPVVVRTEKGISIQSNSDHDFLNVIVIDRSYDTSDVAIGIKDRIELGERKTTMKLIPHSTEDPDLESIQRQVKRNLISTGLHDDEAQSLLDVWSVGLFQQTGLTIIYQVPQTTYDEWIPLRAKPAPVESIRVGMVVHQHLEPELDSIVRKLIGRLSSDDFEIRTDADKQLRSIGGAAIDLLRETAEGSDVESATRARRMLEDFNTDKLLEEVMRRYKEPKIFWR